MREVVFDTETTGLDPAQGHRIVQIGAVELQNFVPTGRTYMTLVNPDRPMEPGAQEIHGISDAMLKDAPRFAEVAEDFLAFAGADRLVAHNAGFDMKFINFELQACGRPILPAERFVDTLELARRRFPGQKLSLDALCKRFGVDDSMRERHDALLDCQILAEVYLELNGGRQRGLSLVDLDTGLRTGGRSDGQRRTPRPHAASPEELAAHAAFLAGLSDPIWSAD